MYALTTAEHVYYPSLLVILWHFVLHLTKLFQVLLKYLQVNKYLSNGKLSGAEILVNREDGRGASFKKLVLKSDCNIAFFSCRKITDLSPVGWGGK